MNKVSTFNIKLKELEKDILYSSLGDEDKKLISNLGLKYWLSFQELRQLTEIIIDLNMWNQEPVNKVVLSIEKKINYSNFKGLFIDSIKQEWERIKNSKIKFDGNKTNGIKRYSPRKIDYNNKNNEVMGMCPVASEKTVCCNLMTIDAVQGCSFGCSYCSIQTFYTDGKVSIDKNLADKLDNISLDPNRKYHIGSGQSSDSLILGNRGGIIDAQLNFARKNPNIIFEFKTKSNNVSYLLKTDVPKNVFVCWSLNPQVFIDNEEHGTASLDQRIDAASKLSSKGVLVGFHFHPIVYFEGYHNAYRDITHKIKSMFSPSDIAMISMGTLTFIKPAIKQLRMSGLKSKVLQIPMFDAVGKSSYTKEIKEEIFSYVWNEFSSWHDEVFFYLCMEESSIWDSVFGWHYADNKDFESKLFSSVSSSN